MPSKPSADSKPLPLEATLHDLAILRASDIDLSKCIPNASDSNIPDGSSDSSSHRPGGATNERDRLLDQSYEYVKEGRSAIRLLHRGDVDVQGSRGDSIRETLEDIVSGLEGHDQK